MTPEPITLPQLPNCPECGAGGRWELAGFVCRPMALHSCQCSQSEYQKAEKACRAAGGHFPETHSAGQHSYDSCTRCGHSC